MIPTTRDKVTSMKKSVRLLFILSVTILVITSVPYTASAQEIKVGVLLPLTGKLSRVGGIERDSFVMATEEINNADGIRGRKIELVIRDTASKPENARSALNKLITEDKVIVVGGGCSSPATYEAAALAHKKKIPFLINTASANKITEEGWGYVFRLNPPVSEYPKTLTAFLKNVARIRTTAILFEESFFGRFAVKKFVKVCKTSGFKIVMRRGYAADRVDFKPLLIRLVKKKPDFVYLITHAADAAMIMQQARELNFNPKLFVWHAPGLTIQESYRYAGEASAYLFSQGLWSSDLPYPGARNYYDKFYETFDSPPDYHGAQAYAAMNVIADALKRSKSLTPKDVREALANTDMMTVFGPVKFISYGKKTQQNMLPTLLLQRLQENFRVVWPKNIASKKYVFPVPGWKERH